MNQLYRKKTRVLLQLLLLVPLFTFAQINLVQTTNNDVVISTGVLNCNASGPSGENSYARLYNLTSLGYSSFEVTKVSFAVQQFLLGSAASFAVNVQVYGSTGGAVTSNLNYLGGASVNITTAMIGTVVEVSLPTPVTVSSPEMLIVVSAPSGLATQTWFYIGGNSNGQTTPAYIKAPDCNLSDFTSYSNVGGQNMHVVLFPTGNPTPIPAQCPPGNVTLTTQAQVNQFAIDYPNCTQINGFLTVGGSNITNLNGLSNLTSTVGSLDITANPLLTDISGLSNITSVGQELAIRNNAVLQSITSLSNINTVTGGLWINGNPQLQSLNGLQNINAVGTGGLIIRNNDALQSISILNGITTVGGLLSVRENAILQNLSGLQNITAVGGDLVIIDNDALQNISALSGVTTVDALWVLRNPQLQTLNGLHNIVEVGEDVDISDNDVLNDITALQNIDPTSITETDDYGLTIVNNPNVLVCNLPNLCTYLTYNAATHPREISGNGGNCITLAAVNTACAAMSIDEFDNTTVMAYPNPVQDVLNLSSAYDITDIAVVNMLGQTVVSRTAESGNVQIDMSALPAGNYFVKATTEKATTEKAIKTIKVIKQ